MKEGLRRYSVGKTYILPQEGGEDGNASLFTSPAIFCGYKVKDSKLTPSTSFAVFATLDGRRRIEVKFTDNLTNSQIGFLTSSNYLSLSNLTVGYTLPTKWASVISMKSVRVYFAGENLFLLTKRQGMDPRYNLGIGSMTTGGGLAAGSYSAMRSITGGLTVTF
jgi:hypothetical protein